MREVGLSVEFLVVIGLEILRKHRKTAIIILAMFGCLIAFNLLKAFVQPANALSTDTSASIDGYFGDEKAYYCSRFSLQGSTVAAACKSPQLILTSEAPLFAATVSFAAAAHAAGCSAYDSIFRQYSWNVSVAEAICQAESGGNPNAVGPTNDYGLMQLHNMPILDPAQNIAAAYQKYQRQGWSAWTSYNTGAFLQFQ